MCVVYMGRKDKKQFYTLVKIGGIEQSFSNTIGIWHFSVFAPLATWNSTLLWTHLLLLVRPETKNDVQIHLILHDTEVMWPRPQGGHWETSVWISSPVSLWLESWLLTKCCPNTAQVVHVSLPCTKSRDRHCLVSWSAGQNNLYCQNNRPGQARTLMVGLHTRTSKQIFHLPAPKRESTSF